MRCGLRVRATSRRTVAAPGVQWIAHDLVHGDDLEPLVNGIDTVVHIAGLAHQFDNVAADRFLPMNVDATARLAAAAARSDVRQLVLVSSSSVYGLHAGKADEHSTCTPDTAYGKSKLAGERAASGALGKSATRLTVLRLVTLFGAGDPGNVFRLMKAIDKRRFLWVGSGSNHKSLLHVSDAARAVILAVNQDNHGASLFNVSGITVPMDAIVSQLASDLDRLILPVHVPGGLALNSLGLAARAFPTRRLRSMQATLSRWLSDDTCDGSAFATRFGFQPRVSLSDGLRDEVVWYRGLSTKG